MPLYSNKPLNYALRHELNELEKQKNSNPMHAFANGYKMIVLFFFFFFSFFENFFG